MSTRNTIILVVLVALALLALVAVALWRRARAKLDRAGDADLLQRRLETERRVNRGLRKALNKTQRSHGVLHDDANTSELVLRTAISLLEADRGMLLSRHDADGDGNLDLVEQVGYDDAPDEDAFVQRLSDRVLERDEVLREERLVAMPVFVRDEFDGVLVCERDEGGFDDVEDEVLLALGDHAGAVLGNAQLRGELRSAFLATVRSLSDAIEAKDPSVRTHSEEVARYVAAVAERMEFDAKAREELVFGSLLHDVGKIGISERILLKPERLTPDEFNVIKLHPRIGHRIVAGIPALAGIAPAVLHHHERYDGGGYPAGLEGDRIPLEARIVGVADSFSAMIADRPYSAGLPIDEACAELERCAGTQFDPAVVRLFVEEVRRNPPVRDPEPTASALEDELAVHRADGFGPAGGTAYTLVDNLTLLHSRSHLHEVLGAECRRAELQDRPFGVVLAELTGLDALNRAEGFAAGDRALLDVAARLRRVEAVTGGVACRAGGARFALVLRGADEVRTDHAARELLGDLREGPACRVSAVSWQTGESDHELLDRARRAMVPA